MVGSTLIQWQRSKLKIVAVSFFVTPLIFGNGPKISQSVNFEPGRFRQSLESSVCAKSTGKVEHALSITFSALIWARNSSKHGTVAIKFGL